jgi:ABC-2 type transport system ATP-binding protein
MTIITSPASSRAATQATAAVALGGVTFSYGNFRAVDNLDLRIAPGEMLALLGPNGAGKSTTISILLGLLRADAGQAELFGQSPAQAIRHGLVAAMLQDNQLLPRATVGELLRFAGRLYPRPMGIDEVAELAGLTGLLRRTTDKLSGGQAQRVRFAMAIIGRPDLLVLDEPTAALDVQARQDFWAAIDDYAAHGKAVLFSTHYLEEADQHADRIVVISGGRKRADGTPDQIRQAVPAKLVSINLAHAGQERAADLTAQLTALPGVTQVTIDGRRARLQCTDADVAVRALAARDMVNGIEVTGCTLEEAFLAITREGNN